MNEVLATGKIVIDGLKKIIKPWSFTTEEMPKFGWVTLINVPHSYCSYVAWFSWLFRLARLLSLMSLQTSLNLIQ